MDIKTRDTAATVTLADECFGVDFHEALIHQAMVTYAQRARQGDASQKTRGEVRGGGAKPWRQKGTGRARAGSIRSPIWRGGGVTHAASKRPFAPKLNKKMYRHAMRSVFSELLRLERLHVVESFDLPEPKTKLAREKLEALQLSHVLLLVDQPQRNTELAIRNLPHYEVQQASRVDIMTLLRYEHVVLTRAALEVLQQRLGASA